MDVIVTAKKAVPEGPIAFQFIQDWIGDLSSDAAVQALAAASDVALVIDKDGVIRDVAVATRELAADGFAEFLKRKWVDTVATDSRQKIVEMLADAQRVNGAAGDDAPTAAKLRTTPAKVKSAGSRISANAKPSPLKGVGPRDAITAPAMRWREINHETADGAVVPIRYCALGAGKAGRIVAVGRDLRLASQLQQRLLQVEQTMERDYARLRAAENRYRMLFHAVGEAVLVVDAGSRRIVEANPASGTMLGVDHAALIGKPISWFVALESQETVAALLLASGQTNRGEPALIALAEGRGSARMSASIFRQDRVTHVLVRMQALNDAQRINPSHGPMLSIVERIPDAFVVVSDELIVLDANAAFLDLAQLPEAAAAIGAPLGRFLGRSAVDVSVLTQTLREHGWVRNFSTVVRTPFDGQEGVDISGVAAPLEGRLVYGFTMRAVMRVSAETHRDLDSLPRSVEQLTDLIGRVPLKEIVRETTDIIERLCVEAALKLTGDNRASAAELLGLSRQSLYSKLHRYEIAGADGDAD